MFSIKGEHDHGPFGGGRAQLVWGQRPDGSLVHITAVERGRRCDCICPACERALVAKKGQKQALHFAHEGGSACSGARETNAHVWAKQILAERKKLWLPAGYARAGKSFRDVFDAQYFEFETVRLERRTGEIVPDVVLSARGRELIVEIYVTHPCDERKIAKIEALGISALEIDLSAYRQAEVEADVADALIGSPDGGALRHWLFNVRTRDEGIKLAEEQRQRDAHLKRRKARAEQAEVDRVLRAARSLKIEVPGTQSVQTSVAEKYDLKGAVGVTWLGLKTAFSAPPEVWQAEIWSKVLIPASSEWATSFHNTEVTRAVRGCIGSAFRCSLPEHIRAAVRDAFPCFLFPEEAVAHYLGYLEQKRLIVADGPGRYRLDDDVRVRLKGRSQQVNDERERREAAEERLARIIRQIPVEERSAFDLQLWRSKPILTLESTLSELVHSGGTDWAHFLSDLNAIDRMLLWGAEAVQSTLGLPIEAANQRVAQRQTQAADRAAQKAIETERQNANFRQERLSRLAAEALGDQEASIWLSAPLGGSRTRIEVARESNAGFDEVQAALAEEVRGRLRDAEANRFRSTLLKAAVTALGTDRAELFIRAHHPRIGASPFEHCVSEAALRLCLSLLPAQRSGVTTRRSGLR